MVPDGYTHNVVRKSSEYANRSTNSCISEAGSRLAMQPPVRALKTPLHGLDALHNAAWNTCVLYHIHTEHVICSYSMRVQDADIVQGDRSHICHPSLSPPKPNTLSSMILANSSCPGLATMRSTRFPLRFPSQFPTS